MGIGSILGSAAKAVGGAGTSAFGSSFLTGAGTALGAGALGSFFGPSKGSIKRAERRQYTNQLHYGPQITAAQIKATVEGAKAAGLHPLAALGISPAAYSPSTPFIPGQSNAGSAIESGLRAGLSHRASTVRMGHQKQIAGLQLEEQQLRNDWLRAQIENSRLKSLGSLANSSQDMSPPPMDQRPGNPTIAGNTKIKTGKSMSAQDAEDRWWEIGGAAQGIINAGADTAQNLLTPQRLNNIVTGNILLKQLSDKLNQYATPRKRKTTRFPRSYRRPGYAGPQPYRNLQRY